MANTSRRVVAAVVLAVVAVGALGIEWYVRHHPPAVEPPPPVMVELPPDEVVHLGAAARGPSRQMAYAENDLAKVVTFAAARRGASEDWKGLPAGTILQVTGALVEGNETWVRGMVEGATPREPLLVHASFLERYMPVVLGTMELSDVRFTLNRTEPRAISGWLRNVTSQTISQCLVTCAFHDRANRELLVTHDGPLVLPPRQLVRFRADTPHGDFAGASVQISHASPDGLRNYLSTVEIPHRHSD